MAYAIEFGGTSLGACASGFHGCRSAAGIHVKPRA